MSKSQIKNHGIDLEKEQREISTEDWVFGAKEKISGLAEKIPNIKKYLPIGELQQGLEDMMDCTNRALNNILETKLTYLYQNKLISPNSIKWLEDNGYIVDDKVVLCDAFNAILSGTTRRGNSLKAPIETVRKSGFIPKHLAPLEKWMRWSDFHNPSRITSAMIKLGKESVRRFPINYERVFANDFNAVIDYDLLDVAGHAWSRPNRNGEYPRTSLAINHAFVYFEKPPYEIFDNYPDTYDGDFIKNLASNYNLMNYGYRVIINEQGNNNSNTMDEEKKTIDEAKLNQIYHEILLREPDADAKKYLEYGENFVRQEVGNSNERKHIIKLVEWARKWDIFKLLGYGIIDKEALRIIRDLQDYKGR